MSAHQKVQGWCHDPGSRLTTLYVENPGERLSLDRARHDLEDVRLPGAAIFPAILAPCLAPQASAAALSAEQGPRGHSG